MKIYIDENLPESCSKCRFLMRCDECTGHENYCLLIGKQMGYDLSDNLINGAPVTPTWERHEDCPLVQRPHGEWIYHAEWELDGECAYECSRCGRGADVDYNFCPNCGADMRKEW